MVLQKSEFYYANLAQMEMNEILLQIFDEQWSLFNIHYQYLELANAGADDWVQYAGLVNREWAF